MHPLPTIPPTPRPNGPLAHFLSHPSAETAHLFDQVGHALATIGTYLGAPVVAVALMAAILVVLARRRHTSRMTEGARLVRILAPPDVDPEGAATLWSNLVTLLAPGWRRLLGAQPHVAFELTSGQGRLGIALWVPSIVPPGLVEGAVEAAWPGARTETISAGPPLTRDAVSTGGELRLAAGEQYPLRTDHRVDPYRSLLGALSGVAESESACVQILARPVTGRRLTRLHRAATYRRSGRPTDRMGRVLDLFSPGSGVRHADTDPTRSSDVAAILGKAGQQCWAITIRYGVATEIADGAKDSMRTARARRRGRAGAIAGGFSLYAGRNRFSRKRLSHPDRVLAARRIGRGDLVSVTELAALAHLPTDVTVAGLARAGAKAVAPPPEVTLLSHTSTHPGTATAADGASGTDGDHGSVVDASAKVLGDAEAGGRRQIALAVPDARFHLHVMGATGSGKSTLLTNLVLGDIDAGRGVVVIDPKGDLVTDICDRMPEGAEHRTVLIDPDEHEAPPILNVLSGPDSDLVVDNLVGIFRSIFAAYWGPRTDDVLRAACLTLLRSATNEAPTSLADVPRLLGEKDFRAPKTALVMDDTAGLGGFWKWYEAMGEAQRSQVIGPVMNKLRAFLLRDFVRQVVGRPSSSFDMGDVLDGGICLVRVPKGILGEETARLLGSFVVAKVWQSATHRARLGQRARCDAALYVDECQNFLNLPRSFDEMLAEARGYGLSMVVAHQHLAQLPKDLREAISANARTKVLFSMSPEDAHSLGRHVAPELTEHDLSHLGAFQAAGRLVVDGEETPPFTLRTRPARPALVGRADKVREAARAAYGTPVESGGGGLVVGTAPEEMNPKAESR